MAPSGVPGAMRTFLILVALALLASGCVTPGGGSTTPPTNGTTNTTAEMGTFPAPINDTKDVQGGAEPVSGVAGPPCSTPAAKCFKYAFQLNGTAHITATLTWGLPASDFDLFVFQDGKQTDKQSACCTPPQPHMQEKIDADLDAGSYEIVVSAASVTQDTYKVAATFSAPTGA